MNFKEIINNNKNAVRSIIKRITNEHNEDLEQEVYCKVWKNSHKYEEQGNFTAWIRTITANVSKDYLKSAHKKLSDNTTNDENVISFIKDKSQTPEQSLLQTERQKRISEAINSLKPKFKEVIMLYEIENNSYEYISQKLNCPIGTVKSRLYNAKQELAKKLEDLL